MHICVVCVCVLYSPAFNLTRNTYNFIFSTISPFLEFRIVSQMFSALAT